MPAELAKDSIDIGIVVTDIDASLAFYRDTLGLTPGEEFPLPGGGTMHRLMVGTTVIKLLVPATPPPAVAPPGGIQGATGCRYWTISVSNIEALVAECGAAGYAVAVPVTVLRPGVTIAIVEDPDGNWVELLKT
jgi:catechol 2,3-dioxygenase-like lactoylglutathione lyase family enzyme